MNWMKTKILLYGLGAVGVLVLVFLMFGKTNMAAEDYSELMSKVSSAEFSPRKSAFLTNYESLQQKVLEESNATAEEVSKNELTDETDINKMIWPYPDNKNVFDVFGSRIHPIKKTKNNHSGWDIGGNYGDTIVAALAGKVITSKSSPLNGLHIVIDHGNGYTTHYLHGAELLVHVGDYVKQGQPIMKCGSTGSSTAPHLHFTVQHNKVAVDPAPYLDKFDCIYHENNNIK